MKIHYNAIAGRSVERLAALSDGIFAVAMTLLVLDLRAPTVSAIHDNRELWGALLSLAPRLLIYVTSFLTLGIFWVGQQTQMNHLQHSNRNLTWIHLIFLFLVTLTPFSTGLLAEFIDFRSALLLYWLNIFLLGATLFMSWVFANRQHLIKSDLPAYIPDAIQRRILITQLLYAVAAAMSFISNRLSIAFIVLVQLNHAIAPRLSSHLDDSAA